MWVTEIEVKGKKEKYSVCEDFITGDTELVAAFRVSKLIAANNNTSKYEAFVKKAEELGIADARQRIDMMLVLDFIIVNIDRHYNNFGLVRDANTLEWLRIAPIFDSGNSMWFENQHTRINPTAVHFESKCFNSTLHDQMKHIKDYSWLNLLLLDGIEDEFAQILENATPAEDYNPERTEALCKALRKRIEMLRAIVNKRQGR